MDILDIIIKQQEKQQAIKPQSTVRQSIEDFLDMLDRQREQRIRRGEERSFICKR